jgi:SAM-dependent methyltransferase
MKTGSVDAVLASLLISYLADPLAVLLEIHRSVRPGGRVVLSVLRRDADMSKLFVEGLSELRSKAGGGVVDHGSLDEAARDYQNQAARLLDLEEHGVFRFWDEGEFAELALNAGFVDVRVIKGFGNPPQAIVLSATRA